MRCPGLPSLRIMRCSMEDSSSPSSLRVWPHSWRSVRNARCRRGRARRTCRTHRRHAVRHIVPARVHLSPGGRARRPCGLQRAFAYRNAYIGQRPAVPARAACSCYSRSCGTVPRRVRHKAYRRPWPSHTLRARPGAACHRSSGISCDPARAGPLRILDICRGQGARRCGGGSVPGRTRGRARGLCKPLAVSCRG